MKGFEIRLLCQWIYSREYIIIISSSEGNKESEEMKMNLTTAKENALTAYKEAKKRYLEERTQEAWICFCNAKTNCMRLGVRI